MLTNVAQIEQLLVRYCHRLDRGTAKEVAELFAEDGAMIPAYERADPVRGREAIGAWYERYISESRSTMTNLKHMPTAIQVDVENDTAAAVAYFTAMFVKKGQFIQAFGTYTDKLVRIRGASVFAEHRIETDLVLPGMPISSP